MGDSKRNIEFTRFIKRNYPKVKSILVVADGLGELSSLLRREGYHTRTFEPRMRDRRKRARDVKYTRVYFTEKTEIWEDLIVGMHPDEATSEIILAAKKNNKPFAVVPCCIVGKLSSDIPGFNAWIKRLTHISGGCNSTLLPIKGKNLVLYKQWK